MKVQCYIKRSFILVSLIGWMLTFFFIAKILIKNIDRSWPDFSQVILNETGVIDANSQWRKLGPETYVFTAYMDDRRRSSVVITVMGFGEKSESPLYGTLVLRNGTKIPLGKYRERRILNPYGLYNRKRLGPYAYLWPFQPGIFAASCLKSIIMKQSTLTTGTIQKEIAITFPVKTRKLFGVCIDSPLFGSIKARTIIENIEINKALGAEWFTIYIYTINRTSMQVLYDYANDGTVEAVQKWGKGLPVDSVYYFGQTLSINDCAYRNMYRVKYLVYTDLDEFVVPKKSIGWLDMMKEIDSFKYGTYLFRNAFFFQSTNKNGLEKRAASVQSTPNVWCGGKLPKFLTFVVRSWNVYSPRLRSKYLIKPVHPSIVGVHHVFQQLKYERGLILQTKTYAVPEDVALLHHYRTFLQGELPAGEYSSNHYNIPDDSALVYKENIVVELEKRVCTYRPH